MNRGKDHLGRIRSFLDVLLQMTRVSSVLVVTVEAPRCPESVVLGLSVSSQPENPETGSPQGSLWGRAGSWASDLCVSWGDGFPSSSVQGNLMGFLVCTFQMLGLS